MIGPLSATPPWTSPHWNMLNKGSSVTIRGFEARKRLLRYIFDLLCIRSKKFCKEEPLMPFNSPRRKVNTEKRAGLCEYNMSSVIRCFLNCHLPQVSCTTQSIKRFLEFTELKRMQLKFICTIVDEPWVGVGLDRLLTCNLHICRTDTETVYWRQGEKQTGWRCL